jgi:predicted nucleic-acid-binding protein
MKWPKKIIDANVILRFLLADDERQAEKAKAFLRNVEVGKDEALLPDIVFAEVVWVLHKVYCIPREEISDKLSTLVGYKGLITPYSKDIFLKSLSLYGAQSSIDIQDILLSEFARAHGCSVVSFNGEDFRKLQAASEEP